MVGFWCLGVAVGEVRNAVTETMRCVAYCVFSHDEIITIPTITTTRQRESYDIRRKLQHTRKQTTWVCM